MTGLKVGLAQRGDYPVDIRLVPELEIPDEREREDIANGRFHGTNNFMVRKATPGPVLVLVPERLADCYKDWFVPGETTGKFVEKYLSAEGRSGWTDKPFVQPLVGTWPHPLGSTLHYYGSPRVSHKGYVRDVGTSV